jgi:hypothetical protein
MKASNYLFPLVFLSVLFFDSCQKQHNPTIEFYITANQSEQFDKLNTTFHSVRAFGLTVDSIISVLPSITLEETDLELITDGSQEPVYLGTSEMSMETITGFDFHFGYSSTITKSGVVYELQNPKATEDHFGACDIQFEEEDDRKVIFKIDVDKSIIEQDSGDLKFLAVINVILE